MVAGIHHRTPNGGVDDLCIIYDVDECGPAHNAGMSRDHVGWVVVEVNGQVVRSLGSNAARNALSHTRDPNMKFTIKIENQLAMDYANAPEVLYVLVNQHRRAGVEVHITLEEPVRTLPSCVVADIARRVCTRSTGRLLLGTHHEPDDTGVRITIWFVELSEMQIAVACAQKTAMSLEFFFVRDELLNRDALMLSTTPPSPRQLAPPPDARPRSLTISTVELRQWAAKEERAKEERAKEECAEERAEEERAEEESPHVGKKKRLH